MNKTWRSAALVAAAVLTTTAGGSTALAASVASQATPTPGPATFAAQAYSPLRTTAAVQITKSDPVPTRTFTDPQLLVDPANPKVMVAATAELRTRVCYLMRSTDGGATWVTLANSPTLPSYPFCTFTSGGVTMTPIAWGRNHTLYYALAGYNIADGGDTSRANQSVLLGRSTDLGNTWTTTIVGNTRGLTGAAVTSDIPVAGIAVDTSGPKDRVYVAFRQNHALATGVASITNSMVAVSNDGGATFNTVNLNDFSNISFTDSTGKSGKATFSTPHVAAGDGKAWVVTSASFSTALGLTGTLPPQPLQVATTTDGGKTYTINPVTPVGASAAVISWSPVGGPQGTVALVYQYHIDQLTGNVQGAQDIYFQRSTDGGKTWSQPARLNDDNPDLLTYHFLPNIDVAPNGRIDVVWDDFRNADGFDNDVYYTYSTDGGVTWAHDIRATDQLVNRNLGVQSNSDIRQPPGVGSANVEAVIGWSDTRLGDTQTQTQDNFSSVVQFKAVATSSGNKIVRYLAAAAGGLVVAGLIVVLLALRRRRRVEPPPPTPTIREREPAGVS